MRPKVVFVKVKSALSKSGLPDLAYALNPYIGCYHACLYCYARMYTRNREISEHWGDVVAVKENLLEVLRREVRELPRGVVGVGTITDPYQPVESEFMLTRGSIKLLLESGFGVSVQTKSPLVLRDLDILSGAREKADVGLTITFVDDEAARAFEPRAPPPSQRVKALEALSARGVKTWIFYGPIIPGVNDDEGTMRGLVELASATGSTLYYDKLRVKEFMWAHPAMRALAERAQSYDWGSLFGKLLAICRERGVECKPGLEYRPEAPPLSRYSKAGGARLG